MSNSMSNAVRASSSPISPAIAPLASGAALPFALLHHTGHGPAHYDLLVQIPSQHDLLAWHLSAPPHGAPSHPPFPARIPDHRPLYLTYEGPISGNRGQVKRLAAGNAILLRQTPAALHLRLPTDPPCEITLPLAAKEG